MAVDGGNQRDGCRTRSRLAARAQAASWLLGQRFDDWELALVVTGESHSAAEAFWHGIDADHPLHNVPSAAAAANSITEVYRATDRFVADVVDAAGADTVVVFSMGGMGPNQSDVPSMVLLPELLLRWACHESLLEVPPEWSSHPRDLPLHPDDLTKSSVSPSWYGSTDGIADTARGRGSRSCRHRSSVACAGSGRHRPRRRRGCRPARSDSTGNRRRATGSGGRRCLRSHCRRSTTAASG